MWLARTSGWPQPRRYADLSVSRATYCPSRGGSSRHSPRGTSTLSLLNSFSFNPPPRLAKGRKVTEVSSHEQAHESIRCAVRLLRFRVGVALAQYRAGHQGASTFRPRPRPGG